MMEGKGENMEIEEQAEEQIEENKRTITQTEKGLAYSIDLKVQKLRTIFKQLKSDYVSIENMHGDQNEITKLHSHWLNLYEEFIETYRQIPDEKFLYEDKLDLLHMYKTKIEAVVLQLSNVTPKDSASQIASQRGSSASTTHSRSSSLLSAKIKEQKKKAEIDAQLRAFESQKQIEMEKLALVMKERELKLKTEREISCATANALDELVKSDVDEQKRKNKSSDNIEELSDHKSNIVTTQVAATNTEVHSKPNLLNATAIPYVPQTSSLVIAQHEDNNLNKDRTCAPQQSDVIVDVVRQLRRPVPDISKFDGDPLDYCKFVRQFKTKIVNNTDDVDEKLNYLMQFTSGKPHQIVNGFAYLDAKIGYPAAMTELEERYGQEDVLADAFIERAKRWPNIKADSPSALDEFAIFLSKCEHAIRGIEAVKVLQYPESIKMLLGKLPFHFQEKWRNVVYHIKERSETVKFSNFVNFIKMEAKKACDPTYGRDALKVGDQRTGVGRVQSRPQPKQSYATKMSYTNESSMTDRSSSSFMPREPITGCIFCNSPSHVVDNCNSFTKKSYEDKSNFLRSKGLCFGCMKHGHRSKDCRARATCSVCKRRHPTCLHNDEWIQNSENTPKKFDNTPRNYDNTQIKGASAFSSVSTGNGECTMAVIPVRVKLKDSLTSVNTYAFLDPGSNVTFCSNNLLQRLGGSGKRLKITLDTMGDTHVMTTTAVDGLQIGNLEMNNIIDLPRVYTKDNMPVSNKLIPTMKDVAQWTHLEDVVVPSINSKVGILIGNNIPDAYTPIQVRTGPRGSPHATQSLLGWILWNVVRTPDPNSNPDLTTNRANVSTIRDETEELDKMIRNTYNLEFPERTVDDKRESSVEDKCFIKQIEDSIKLSEGHYITDLPFRNQTVCMPNNYPQAVKRLTSLKHKMMRYPDFKSDYQEFMEKLLKRGYAERIPETDLLGTYGRVWYLPHHGVYHPRKPGKLRVVFDCSANYLGAALNSVLLQGPDMTNKLLGVLLRFRQEKIGLMGDIEAMYHQVRVNDNDRDFLRFLWWPDGNINKTPETHRMKVHLFGAISSPSCANFALRKTASDNQDSFEPEIGGGIRRNFYVDDYLGSKATEDEAISLIHDTKAMCMKGGFKLTKWLSNSHTVLKSVPEDDRSKEVKCFDLKQDILPSERALGVLWKTETDTLGFKIGERNVPCTRRGILSLSSSIYDPFGFTAPFVLIPKFILQELCRIGVGWDDKIEGTNLRKWNKWVSELHLLENLNIERCFKPNDFASVMSYELHHFADASETGYGMVTYLRMLDDKGRIHCSFVFGKARVTPLKKVTIPRLELTAATALVRINAMLLRELDFKIDKIFYWTDSMSVLRYLANEKCRFHTFVANRIQIIHEASTNDQWQYVNTLHNPADHASRGLTMTSLLQTKQWFNGPDFLWKAENLWEQTAGSMNYDLEEDPEVKHVHTAVYEMTIMDRLFERFSDWMMLKKIAAWLLIARNNLLDLARKRNQTEKPKHAPTAKLGPKENQKVLSVSELKRAERALVRYVQAEHFSSEIKTLQAKGRISKSSRLVKLDPFLSESPMSRLILEDAHRLVGHLGKNAILAHTRQTYWIVGANSLIKGMLAKCVTCKKHQGTPNTQKMASLPEERVTINSPFSKVGVDYFGPFEIKRGRSLVKRWGVIFTCLTVRAVHLEVAASLDTDSCICAIRRFIARRGPVKYMRSDNGTNFVGAERELREEMSKLDSPKIQGALLKHNIHWEFNPPTASNFGGVWERLIRLVRKVMYSLLHTQTVRLDDEGLNTLFCEVEGILNGRPISEMPNSPNDLDALTPNHLLLFRGGELAPPGVFYKEDS